MFVPDNRALFFGIVIWCSMVVVSAAEQPDEVPVRYSVRTTKAYDSIVADLKFAITERNYRITSENDIGAALSRRHGSRFNPSTVIHFCNLETARTILDAAPDFLLHMPCKIAVYKVGDEIIIETWLLPVDPRIADLATKINDVLRAIVSEAAR